MNYGAGATMTIMFTTSKDLRVEAEENGVASRMVKGEEHLLIASQAGAFLNTELFIAGLETGR